MKGFSVQLKSHWQSAWTFPNNTATIAQRDQPANDREHAKPWEIDFR